MDNSLIHLFHKFIELRPLTTISSANSLQFLPCRIYIEQLLAHLLVSNSHEFSPFSITMGAQLFVVKDNRLLCISKSSLIPVADQSVLRTLTSLIRLCCAYLLTNLSTYLSVYVSLCLYNHRSICLHVCLPLYLYYFSFSCVSV